MGILEIVELWVKLDVLIMEAMEIHAMLLEMGII
jgi:hypothetical protein